jgi:hypothetical protein
VNYYAASGAGSLGVLVGWMVYHTFVRQERLDAKFLGSIVSVMLGAGVIGFFRVISPSGSPLPQEVYLYLVGLLFGVVMTAALKFVGRADREREQRTDKGLESAKDSIITHIGGKSFRMMSFDRLSVSMHLTMRLLN